MEKKEEKSCVHSSVSPVVGIDFGDLMSIQAYGGYCSECKKVIVRGALFGSGDFSVS